MPAWSDYQDQVAEFFRSLGMEADTNVAVQGVRTKHDVDVEVRGRHVGFELFWIVECKRWATKVPKEKVLALRTIVDDVGADRGIMMAESGYQSGALQAARSTNVMLTSLADLRETLAYDLGNLRLEVVLDRVDSCRERYWELDKSVRIEVGLRPESVAPGYSGDVVIKAVDFTARQALRHGFPIPYDREVAALLSNTGRRLDAIRMSRTAALATPAQLSEVLEGELAELEARLEAGEARQAGENRERGHKRTS